jgi:hypothetical protein
MHVTHRTHGAGFTTRLGLFLLTVVFLAILGNAIVSTQAQPAGRTVWDGV